MNELKNTLDLETFLVNDLKSDDDIKSYLNANLRDCYKSQRFSIGIC